jgi:hypothetical protein
VALENIDISTVTSPEYEFTLGLGLNQFKRKYVDGYSFNIFEGFNGVVDTSTKNFSNFYLSDCRKFNDFINSSATRIESGKILTTLKLGDEYLTFENIDPTPYKYLATYEESLNYGKTSFGSVGSQFNIEFFDNRVCVFFYVSMDLFILIFEFFIIELICLVIDMNVWTFNWYKKKTPPT